jgi:hypothetical protein
LLSSDSRRWWAATRADTGVPVRVERVRATPPAPPGLLGVGALGVGRCGVPVGVSRPVPVAGAFLTALAILLLLLLLRSLKRYSTGSGTQKTARCGQRDWCVTESNAAVGSEIPCAQCLVEGCLRNNGK